MVVVTIVFANNWGEFNSDTRGDLYLDPGRVLASSLSSWTPSPIQTGTPNFNTGFAPIAAFLWIVRFLGTPAWVTVRLWRAGLILLAGWGAVRLLRVLVGDRSTAVGRVATALMYVGNCFLIIGAASTQVLLPFALLPWLVITFKRSADAPRSWLWPAAFGLVFFAMTGMQAGVVPLYLLSFLPAYVLYARLAERKRWRDLIGVVARCGILSVLVSLYWLVPSALASSSGATVAAETEDPRLISLTTSYAENLRLLGQWPLYGRFGQGLFVPKAIGYLANPLIVISTFCYPVVAAIGAYASRAKERLFAVLLTAVAVPLMVGMYPPDDSAPSGRLLKVFLEKFPGGIAFRTTSKVSPVALLGFALLAGLGVSALTPRLASLGRYTRAGLVATTAVVVIAVTLPAWNGNLFPSPFHLPGYWAEAADDLNTTSRAERVLIVPGSDGAQYRWARRGPDDIFNLVFDKNVVSRLTVSQGAIYPANFLAALDVSLNTSRATDSTTSTMGRYLGAGQVVARQDLNWEIIHAGRPSVINRQLLADPGLELLTSYGAAGENTTRPAGTDQDREGAAADAELAPLRVFSVRDAEPMARIESAVGAYVIDGDNFAVPALTQLGMMAGNPAYQLAGNMTTADLAAALAADSRLVITDTNRRRLAGVHAVDDSYSITLPPEGPVRGQTATSTTLWPERPSTQTVARLRNVASITATRSGAEFSLTPTGQPTAAFDGDPRSAWVASAFGNAPGQGIRVALDEPTDVRRVAIDVSPPPPANGITALKVSSGSWEKTVRVSASGTAEAELPPGDVSEVNVTVAESTSRGTVGISEIRMDGVQPMLYAQMPSTLSDLAAGLSDEARERMATAPLDVLMTRRVGFPGASGRDEERVVNRQFTIPTDRTFVLTGSLSGDEPLTAVPLATMTAAAASGSCVRIGQLDDRPVEVRFVGKPSPSRPQVKEGIEGCGAPLTLGKGSHQLTTDPGWPIAVLRLSATEARTPQPATPPRLTVTGRSNTTLDARIEEGDGPYFLLTGNAYDARWAATIDGQPLGTPIVVDGYSTGWRIDKPGEHRIQIRFLPQRAMNAGLVASAAGVLLCGAVVIWPRRRLRVRPWLKRR